MNAPARLAAFREAETRQREAETRQREAERRAALFRALWARYGPDGERLPG